MNFLRLTPILLLLVSLGTDLWAASPGDYRRRSPGTWRQQHDEKNYLFPGTGIFGKNRDPIEFEQAKEWFLLGESEEKKGDLKKQKDKHEYKLNSEEVSDYNEGDIKNSWLYSPEDE